jgi:hypothetical protein
LLFSALERDGATRITLGPLDGDAVASLLTDAFGALAGMPAEPAAGRLADTVLASPRRTTVGR